ncbi:P-loop containing nucleoside triphosphate hydrolase protein [Blyttiomyces helicus]|uniref:P-loop containing nucleoside triphosphate hydrolase protein n=1 Tax=Blyttiomyces helicus TaxID=388810 RepID=A0A4P9WNU6_9FUNG|nr:P-loop containing nucleoside triphosphate hydrolase protein [Blyttiomyces helicus]|eukprot:RKO94162.1 P-loop containing nucleoside triphosphate hydrolase protein [Blyttiomyces helicus]
MVPGHPTFMRKPHKNGVDDLVLLSEVSENAICDTLKKHYDADEIYVCVIAPSSSIGCHAMIVRFRTHPPSLNPYRDISNLYSEQTLQKYVRKLPFENAPHVYALAEDAHRSMMKERENVGLVFFVHKAVIDEPGESGAGKTEASKRIMEYVAAVCENGEGVADIKDKLLQSNPVLEAFGNAKTLRNDNSSRFGKYMEMQFNYAGNPIGGKITNYLLEKSRVVKQQQGERNFHIFYQLLAGISGKQRDEMSLGPPEKFSYLNQSGTFKVSDRNDNADFKETQEAMTVVGLTDAEQSEILKLLASILHIGNLEFGVVKDKDGKEKTAVKNKDGEIKERNSVTGMWSREEEESGREERTATKLAQAGARDSLAKNIYSRLFNWIVVRLNENMANSAKSYVIGVLDIYGFEIFDRNSFEQLCINYTNEKLHQIFIELTLKAEQEEYVREGIPWTEVKYVNNKPCCELIEKQHHLIDLLDEECLVPAGTDTTFHAKVQNNLRGKPNWVEAPRMQTAQKTFVIKVAEVMLNEHYAADVPYDCEGILEKNKDTLFLDLLELMMKSGTRLAKTLFEADAARDSKKRPVTAATQFRPNGQKSGRKFEKDLVSTQIRYLGLLENVKVRRAGYAHRQTFLVFFERYKVLLPFPFPPPGDAKKECVHILDAIGISKDDYKVGKSKMFIKAPDTVFKLESLRDVAVEKLIVKMQRAWRGFVSRKWYLELRTAARDLVIGKKERRPNTLNRKFWGKYLLGLDSNPDFKAIMSKNGESKIVFSDNVRKLNRGFKWEPRVFVLTDKNSHWFEFRSNKVSHHQQIAHAYLTKVSLSELADTHVVLHFEPPKSGPEKAKNATKKSLVIENLRKTEIAVCVREQLGSEEKKVEVVFSNSIEYEHESGKKRTLQFETVATAAEVKPLKAKGSVATITVCQGLAKTSGKRGKKPNKAPAKAAPPSGNRAPPPPPSAGGGRKSQMEYEFIASNPKEVSVSEGETITVLGAMKDGWTRVRTSGGKEGLVPSKNSYDNNGRGGGVGIITVKSNIKFFTSGEPNGASVKFCRDKSVWRGLPLVEGERIPHQSHPQVFLPESLRRDPKFSQTWREWGPTLDKTRNILPRATF